MNICVIVGMETEAKIVRQVHPSANIIIGAGDAIALAEKLEEAIAAGAEASS